jgi:hypothetical protein
MLRRAFKDGVLGPNEIETLQECYSLAVRRLHITSKRDKLLLAQIILRCAADSEVDRVVGEP